MAPRPTIRPQRLNSSIAWLFMIGSLCFALGAAPGYESAVGALIDASTYFVGSIFFTSASLLQLLQAQSPDMAPGAASGEEPAALRLVAWLPHDRNWLAAVTQFPGTLAFNVSTLFAISVSLSVSQVDRAVWRPDFVGSTLFLVSSGFALAALNGSTWRAWRLRDLVWVIAWLNMLGSVAFMASALASFLVPWTGNALNERLADTGTFVGAVGFFLGAALMLPAWREAMLRAVSQGGASQAGVPLPGSAKKGP